VGIRSNVNVTEKIKEHSVTDYNFMFPGSGKLTVCIDHDAGDTAVEHDDRYELDTVARPGLTDPDDQIDPEHMVIYKRHLAVVIRTERKQRQPSEEELFNMRKTLHALAGGSH
jgi:hypothetical protein